MQYWASPSESVGQSTSVVQGAQYSRGLQIVYVPPVDRASLSAFGDALTVAHHQPPGQSVSLVQL
jgi:hypothetical protein